VALFGELDALLAKGQAATPEEVARILVDTGKVCGAGIADSKARRLARRFREFQCIRIHGPPERTETPPEAMAPTATAPAAPDADLAVRVAALEAQCAAYAAKLGENETMMTGLINAVRESLQTQLALKDRVLQLDDHVCVRLDRHNEGVERLLDQNGVPRLQ
jgi:hypothetical protein